VIRSHVPPPVPGISSDLLLFPKNSGAEGWSGGSDHPAEIGPAAHGVRWKRQSKLKTGQRTGSMKTASSGVRRTMLVPMLSHGTRGGQKGAVLAICSHLQMFNWLPRARGEWCTPHAQQRPVCTESHDGVVGDFPPHTSVPESGSRSLWGQKEYPGKQAREERGKQRLVTLQPATPTQSRGGTPGWTYTESHGG